MITDELRIELDGIQKRMDSSIERVKDLEQLCDEFRHSHDADKLEEYKKLLSSLDLSKNKLRKRIENEIETLETNNPFVKEYYETIVSLDRAREELESNQKELENATFFIDDRIRAIISVLIDCEFVSLNSNYSDADTDTDTYTYTDSHSNVPKENSNYILTEKGFIASQIQEVNPLVFSEILINGTLNNLTVEELVAVLSSFVSLRVPEEQQVYSSENNAVHNVMQNLNFYMDTYYDLQLNTLNYVDESQYTLVYDIQDFMINWCASQSEEESKILISSLSEKEIFLGELVKCILKINNIAHELTNVCDSIHNIELKHKLSQIPELTMKYVATNQSLYI